MKYIGKRNVWEELSRSAETSSMIQKKSIPRKKPTYQRATTLSRPPKLVVWEKCRKQIIESKWYIPTIWVARKNKNPNLNASDLKCDLTLFPSLRDHCFNSVLQWKIQNARHLHHRRNSFVQTVCWHSKQTDTRDKVILSESSDTFFFPIISLPTLKAVSTFRPRACCKCNLQRMGAGPRMAGLVLHPDYAWAVGYEGKPPDEWLWLVKKWNMSLYDSMSNKRYGDKRAPQNELIKSETCPYRSTK